MNAEAKDFAAAEILAVLLRLPQRERMGVLALAIRATLDSEMLDEGTAR